MIPVINDIDRLLQAAPSRYGQAYARSLQLSASARVFEIALDATVSPSAIVFIASRVGFTGGTIEFATDNGTPLAIDGDVATLVPAAMMGSGCEIVATVTYQGEPHVARQSVAKQLAFDSSVPPAPTGLVAQGALASINLRWDPTNNTNIGTVQIWRALTNDLGAAAPVGETAGLARGLADVIGAAGRFYYWIRYISKANIPGPFNASAGTLGTTGTGAEHLLELLKDQITESELFGDLRERIDLVDAEGTGLVDRVDALVETYGDTASSADSAAQAAEAAEAAIAARAAAILAAGDSVGAASAANSSKLAAEASNQGAGTAAAAAATSAQNASSYATAAESAAGASNTSKLAAEAARGDAAASASAAVTARDTAVAKAGQAGDSASSASTSANTASTKAGDASSAASRAATSESNAAGSASSASTSATNAANSANAGGGSAQAAAGSASTAATQASNAGTSATAANAARVAAESARDAASGSAAAASTSASSASTSAGDAGWYANSASQSANTASTAAGSARSYSESAAQSVTDAAGSANSASISATNAANSANAVGGSAQAAAGSASTAATQASNAGTSATAANAARVAAESARDAASGSAAAASTSASSASTAAGDAGWYANSASQSANTANTAAGSALSYRNSAAQSVIDAQGYASAAATDYSAVNARLNNYNNTGVTVEQKLEASASDITGLRGQYTLKVDNNGYVTGFGLASSYVNGIPTSAFIINADRFAVVAPGLAPKVMFAVGQVEGQTAIGINGETVIDGSLTLRAPGGKVVLSSGKTLAEQTKCNPNLVPSIPAWTVETPGAVWKHNDTSTAGYALDGMHLVFTKVATNGGGLRMARVNGLRLEANTNYTISFNAIADAPGCAMITDLVPDTLPESGFTPGNNVVTRHVFNWRTGNFPSDAANAGLRIFSFDPPGQVLIWDIKLERGTDDTQWVDSIITPFNASTFIAAASIQLAHIDRATITNLAAIVAYIGRMEIGPGGHVRQGMLDYNNGIGFFVGEHQGVTKLMIGDPNGAMMWWDGSQLQQRNVKNIVDESKKFKVTISGNLLQTVGDGPQNYGNLTATASGEFQAPISIRWGVDYGTANGTSANAFVSGATNTATTSFAGSATRERVYLGVFVQFVDAAGRVATAEYGRQITHGAFVLQ